MPSSARPGKGLLLPWNAPVPWHGREPSCHLSDSKLQDSLLPGPLERRQIARRSVHSGPHSYRAQSVKDQYTRTKGQVRYYIGIQHAAGYCSDSSHRFPGPPPSLQRRGSLLVRRSAVSRWDQKTYVAKAFYVPQTSPSSWCNRTKPRHAQRARSVPRADRHPAAVRTSRLLQPRLPTAGRFLAPAPQAGGAAPQPAQQQFRGALPGSWPAAARPPAPAAHQHLPLP